MESAGALSGPLRVLQVGCGGISRLWLEAATRLDDVEVVGLVDVVEDAARAQAAAFDLDVPVGADLPAMLGRLRPDAVFDCTVPEAHHGVTVAALRAGCHVFGEKPMAGTLTQARAMIATARSVGRTYAVMQNRRQDPALRRLRELVAGGAIGELTTLDAGFYLGAHFGGFREVMPHVLIRDMAIHTFDAARFLSGRDARAVYCHEWNPAGSWYARDAAAMAIFELDGGAVFGYRGSWCAEGLPTSWEAEWRLVGTEGSLRWDGGERIVKEVVAGREGFLYPVEREEIAVAGRAEGESWHARAVREFVTAVRDGREPDTVCSDNVRSLAMVLGAVESAERRERVPIATDATSEPTKETGIP